ncbi:MAG: response regulator [Desulfuromonadaceae bacterium]|nr:response regulator [Desulfuromonadaceae bacterium]
MSIQPLRRILVFQSAAAIILPFAVVLFFGLLWAVPQVRKDAGTRQVQLANIVGMQVERYLETGAAIVRAAGAMPRGDQQYLTSLLDSTDSLSSLYEISADGTVTLAALHKNHRAHLNDQIGLNLSRNPLFLDVMKYNKPRWSKIFLSVVGGGLVAAYGVPGDGVTVIGEIDLAHLITFLKLISTENELLILIVDHNGQVIADNSGRFTAQQLNIGNHPLVRDGISTDAPTTGRFDFSGTAMTGSMIQIQSVDWHVIVAKANSSLYRTPLSVTLIVLSGILIAVCCGIFASVYLARKLSRRFNDLAHLAQDIAQGGNPDNWPTSAISEFNQLSENLQVMATELRRQDMIMRESEERYRTLVDNIPLGIALIDCDYKIIMVNTTQAALFAHSREWFIGRNCYDTFEKRDETCPHCPRSHSLATGSVAQTETEVTKADGRTIAVRISSVPLFGPSGESTGFIEVLEDITDTKRAEEEKLTLEKQLLHAQKLESLGVLAGGIAHDFNNILTAIIGNADLALMRLNRESPAVDNLHRIEQAASRAADLARQMLAYSGKGKFVVENINLNILLEEMLHMLEVSISKKAVLRLNTHQQLPLVEADATQMRQIIMNLVINASEAIGDKSGVIAITTGCMECDRSYLKDVWLDENLINGLYVYLEIVDNGCGMNRETLAKLFDPFYTTKFTGRGLGMAAVLGIVRGHKGAIKVYSEVGKGTSFKILLPASGKPAEIFNGASPPDNWHGTGTVLLVDDEETIRAIGAEMLRVLGFTTITAEDGRAGLNAYTENPGISFVILDLTMPHMDGEQCYSELRRLNPDVKVIISSGYNEQEVTQKFIGKGLAGFVQKPYKLSVLKEVIRNISPSCTLTTQEDCDDRT